jgi:hypothetical protein
MRALLALTPPTVVRKLGRGGTSHIRNTAGMLLTHPYAAPDVAAELSLFVVPPTRRMTTPELGVR